MKAYLSEEAGMPQFRRLVWDPQYTVHDETLDAQHQELFRITNNLLDLYEQGSVALSGR